MNNLKEAFERLQESAAFNHCIHDSQFTSLKEAIIKDIQEYDKKVRGDTAGTDMDNIIELIKETYLYDII